MDVKKETHYINIVLDELKTSLARNVVDIEILKWMMESPETKKEDLPLMEKSKLNTEAQIEKISNSIKLVERVLAEKLSDEHKGVN